MASKCKIFQTMSQTRSNRNERVTRPALERVFTLFVCLNCRRSQSHYNYNGIHIEFENQRHSFGRPFPVEEKMEKIRTSLVGEIRDAVGHLS